MLCRISQYSPMFPSCLFVPLSDGCIIITVRVEKAEKTWAPQRQQQQQQQGSSFDMWNDIYISKEAVEINYCTFTTSDIFTSLVPPHPLSHFQVSLCLSVSLCLFPHSNINYYSSLQHICMVVGAISWLA